jgi:tetratricopeptide (TPR) repeat protein
MLLDQFFDLLTQNHVCIVSEGLSWGSSYAYARLSCHRKIWLELKERDYSDPVSQGNLLAAAINRAVNGRLCPDTLHYKSHLATLAVHAALLGPYTFILVGAEQAPEFAAALLEFAAPHRVILDFAGIPDGFTIPDDACVINAEALSLTLSEAHTLAAELVGTPLQALPIPAEEGLMASGAVLDTPVFTWVEAAWRQAAGSYEQFIVAAHQALDLPAPRKPSPTGLKSLAEPAQSFDPETLLAALQRDGQWIEALEFSIARLPQQIDTVLKQAGHFYYERGLHRRLLTLLSQLPSAYQQTETVLFWRLMAASELAEQKMLRAEVEAYLQTHEASELRALYADVLAPLEAYTAEVERAYAAKATPYTLYQWGSALALIDAGRAEPVLRKALAQAERGGYPYEVCRNAKALGALLGGVGKYSEAWHYLQYGLQYYDTCKLSNVFLRLSIVNDLVFYGIFAGRLAELSPFIRELEHGTAQIDGRLRRVMISTLGDYFLVVGEVERALAWFSRIWQDPYRLAKGPYGQTFVRILLEVNDVKTALKVGQQAYQLTRHEHFVYARRATAAYGMALSVTEPAAALPYLDEAIKGFQAPMLAHCLAQVCLYAAYAHLQLGEIDDAKAKLEAGQVGLAELSESGLRYLVGPDRLFCGVWQLLGIASDELEVNLLGEPQVRFRGERIFNRQNRYLEILAILLLNPQGLSGEALLCKLCGDSDSTNNLKGYIFRMRKVVPIASQPYQVQASYRADFLELERLLREGKVTEAIGLYRGPLLPRSQAPAIVEHREVLEEAVRRAALGISDANAILQLAQVICDDLELWEAGLRHLNQHDPRYPIVAARVEQLRVHYGE